MLGAAVLIACGVYADGRPDVLGCSVSLSEAEVCGGKRLPDRRAQLYEDPTLRSAV